ncbi:uncharacterized protein LOC132933012 [Metopolophium dirhodum]|uniref:uncharacterized protein LOC132933012 n=1 Tax=Metopolophium dirhodum TaxID=44670 RepID=UPI0029901F14|nr:uncharacterized protein LOC132933012 [Metopolophium dirhodum]
MDEISTTTNESPTTPKASEHEYVDEQYGIPLFNSSLNYKTEHSFKRSVTGTLIPTFFTQSFLKDINGVIETRDIHEFYTFLNVCHKKLLCNIPPGDNEKCGFIRINSESIVPYCTHDSQKYLPMFYFEGATKSLKPQAVKLKNWNLAYLKFCLLVQGTINELFYSDFCTMVSLDCIKNFYTDLNVEEYWPATEVNTHFLTYQKSSHVNPTGIWIRAPIEVVPAENTIPHILIEPAPSKPQSIPVTKNNYLSGCPASQMVNLYSTQAQPPSTTSVYSLPARNQSIAAQCYNTFLLDFQGSAMSQGSSLINSAGHVVPPPPLVHAGNMAPEIGQCVTTIYNGITNSNVMSHSSQMRQFYTQSSNNGKALQQLQQQQTITNPNIGWELTRIPERMCTHITSNNDAYKIQRGTLQARTIYCVNAEPYEYSDVMVTLHDIVQVTLPASTDIATCAYVLREKLNITLFSGNSEQLAVLRENGRLRSMHPDDTPMVMLKDIKYHFRQFKTFVELGWQKEQIQQYSSVGGPSKRQRTS